MASEEKPSWKKQIQTVHDDISSTEIRLDKLLEQLRRLSLGLPS